MTTVEDKLCFQINWTHVCETQWHNSIVYNIIHGLITRKKEAMFIIMKIASKLHGIPTTVDAWLQSFDRNIRYYIGIEWLFEH